MECRDEQERSENGNLPRDTPLITPEQLALEALIDSMMTRRQEYEE